MIYLCIPTHNEAATVGVLMWKARKVLGEFGRDYRFLVLDDASTDGTREILQRYRRKLPLTVIRSEERLGYGRAVERLLREAVELAPYPKRDCAVVLQADFTENPEDVVTLVKVLEGGADVVAGYLAEDQVLPRGVGRIRRLAGLLLGKLVGRAPVSDLLTGLRAYRVIVLKKALRELPDGAPLLTADGLAANVELLAKLTPHARRVEEAPLRLRYELRARPSRFRALATGMALFRLRGSKWWSGTGAEAA